MSSDPYQPVDPKRLRTYSIRERAHKVSLGGLAKLPLPGAGYAEWLDSLPGFLGADEFRAVVDAVVAARRADRPVVMALGGHVIKVGCSPIIVDLIRRKLVTAVAMNGSTAIHDVELATQGATSEDVAETIHDGSFGMVKETLDFFSSVHDLSWQDRIGLGQATGRWLVESAAPHLELSILAAAFTANIPSTVHVALGTDTVHTVADGAKMGAATMHDFRLICSVVCDLGAAKSDGPGGVWLNIGSAVVLPEVFLKAVAVARNLGANLDALVTANFDMLKHYRPMVNVVQRPTRPGRGHAVIGHHEILLPMLRQAVVDRWEASNAK